MPVHSFYTWKWTLQRWLGHLLIPIINSAIGKSHWQESYSPCLAHWLRHQHPAETWTTALQLRGAHYMTWCITKCSGPRLLVEPGSRCPVHPCRPLAWCQWKWGHLGPVSDVDKRASVDHQFHDIDAPI